MSTSFYRKKPENVYQKKQPNSSSGILEHTSNEEKIQKPSFFARLKKIIFKIQSFTIPEVSTAKTSLKLNEAEKREHRHQTASNAVNELLRNYSPQDTKELQQIYLDLITQLKEENRQLQEVLAQQQIGKFNLPFGEQNILNKINELIQENPTEPLVLIYLDLKGMKFLNDSVGMKQADIEIQRFIDQVKASIHPTDPVFQLQTTGDEFFIIMPNCTAEAAHGRLLKFQNILSSTDIKLGFYAAMVEYHPDMELDANNPGESLIQLAESGIITSKKDSEKQILAENADIKDTRKAEPTLLGHITIVDNGIFELPTQIEK